MKILRTAPFPRDNFGADYGGGIFNSGAQLEVIHCTLMRNSAKSYGNGIYIQDGGTLQLVNSIIWNEGGTAAQEIYFANLPGVSVIKDTLI